jgi:hypothetical protein
MKEHAVRIYFYAFSDLVVGFGHPNKCTVNCQIWEDSFKLKCSCGGQDQTQ